MLAILTLNYLLLACGMMLSNEIVTVGLHNPPSTESSYWETPPLLLREGVVKLKIIIPEQ